MHCSANLVGGLKRALPIFVLKFFVWVVSFGHNYGPLNQKKPHQKFSCRLRKSTPLRAIDLAIQHMHNMVTAIFWWIFLISLWAKWLLEETNREESRWVGGYYIVGGSTLRITATSCKYTQLHISVYSMERKNVCIQTDFKSVCMCTFMCTNSDRKTETKTKYPACARFPNLEKTKRCTKSIVLRLFTHPPSHLFQPQTAANLCSSTHKCRPPVVKVCHSKSRQLSTIQASGNFTPVLTFLAVTINEIQASRMTWKCGYFVNSRCSVEVVSLPVCGKWCAELGSDGCRVASQGVAFYLPPTTHLTGKLPTTKSSLAKACTCLTFFCLKGKVFGRGIDLKLCRKQVFLILVSSLLSVLEEFPGLRRLNSSKDDQNLP